VDELLRRIDRGRARLEFGDIPEPLRAGLLRAAPGTNWTHMEKTPDGYGLYGKTPGGQNIGADVARSGSTTLRTYIAPAQLPAPIIADLKRRSPAYNVLRACSIGPALEKVDGYEVRVELQRDAGEWLKLEYGADGAILQITKTRRDAA